jgi:subtilisin family serine protease
VARLVPVHVPASRAVLNSVTSHRSWARLALPIALALASGCGKDETDLADLNGEVGVVPGAFSARLAEIYRSQVDSLEDKVNGVAPGLSAEITQRFAGKDEAIGEGGARLSDLLKLKLPGTGSDLVNQEVFTQLGKLSGDDGPYFDLVDTEKYLKKSLYDVPTGAAEDANLDDQYYLEMIHWQDAVEGITPALLADAAPVVVAVLDTGVLATHEDLTGVMWQQTVGEDSGAVGYDATTGTVLAKADSKDAHGHGTHVAGIIGAEGGNGKGVHGVGFVPGQGGDADASITEIMAVKVLNDNGSATSDQIGQGIKWAVDAHRLQKASGGARAKQRLIVNMSLGGPFEAQDYQPQKDDEGHYVFTDDILTYATAKKDTLIVVAAGNESCGISGACDMSGVSFKETFYYPCSYDHVLCVAATTHEDKLAGFSNRKGSVGIAAPGFQIVSTLPASKSEYGYFSGTSQATPVTAGAAAVVWSLYPDLEAEDLKLVLQKTATKVSDISGQITSGDGRVDLEAALAYAAALKAKGKKPSEMDPPSGVVSSDPVKPKNDPDTAGTDPYAKSPDAVGAGGPNDKGKGSAQGCATIGAGTARSARAATWMVLCFPLVALGGVLLRSTPGEGRRLKASGRPVR